MNTRSDIKSNSSSLPCAWDPSRCVTHRPLADRIAAVNRVQADMERLTGQPMPRFDEYGIAHDDHDDAS